MAEKRIIKAPRGVEHRAAARLTGRYIMAFRRGAHDKVSASLAEAGFPAARTKPLKARVAHPLPHGGHYILPILGFAVIDPHSDLEEKLVDLAGREEDVLSLAPERIGRIATGSPDYLRGWRDATDALTASLLAADASKQPSRIESSGAAAAASPNDDWWLAATGVKASSLTGAGIRIGILDTGMDLSHPDFKGRDIIHESLIGDVRAFDDKNGHGTLCVGLAAGPLNPNQGARYGVAYESSLYVARVMSDDGFGAVSATVIQGMENAVKHGCAVISMSIEIPWDPIQQAYDPDFERAIENALAQKCLVVAAAGNERSALGAPGNSPSALAVASVDRSLATANDSNRKIDEAREVRGPDLAAPGVDIRSCWPVKMGGYTWDSGTSLACPQVAGIAALLAQGNSALRGADLKAAVIARCRPLANEAARKGEIGAGLVQAPP